MSNPDSPKNSKPPKDNPKIKPSVFPKSVLSQINENTSGGFILVYIDSEGHIQPVIQTDNQAMQLGLISFCANFFSGVNEFNEADMRGEVCLGDMDEDEDDE